MESNLPQQNISIEQLPTIIGNTFKHISEVDRKISNAVSRAEEAKKLADEASQKNAGWSFFGSDKKEAIEALQSAAISQANALSDSVDANKELFNNQKKMSEALRYLFGLGVANIAANRTVVRELELKLKNASQEELSELARQEITNVILQLRAQEDMQYKLENHDRILREHKVDIDKILGDVDAIWNDVEGHKANLADFHHQVDSFIEKVNQTTERINNDITALQQYRTLLETYQHLGDVDAIWNDVEGHKASITKLQDQMNQLISEVHTTTKEIKESINNLEKANTDAHLQYERKIKTAYYISGSAIGLSIINYLLQILGII